MIKTLEEINNEFLEELIAMESEEEPVVSFTEIDSFAAGLGFDQEALKKNELDLDPAHICSLDEIQKVIYPPSPVDPFAELQSDNFGGFSVEPGNEMPTGPRNDFLPEPRNDFPPVPRNDFPPGPRNDFPPGPRNDFPHELQGDFLPELQSDFLPELQNGFLPELHSVFLLEPQNETPPEPLSETQPETQSNLPPEPQDDFPPEPQDDPLEEQQNELPPDQLYDWLTRQQNEFPVDLNNAIPVDQPSVLPVDPPIELTAEHPDATEKRSDKKALLKRMPDILFYVVIAFILAVTLIFGGKTHDGVDLFGYSGFTVLSGSMQREIPEGSLVITKSVDPATIQVGNDITFIRQDNTIVTHRVISIVQDTTGNKSLGFQTQGLENPEPDQEIVHAGNVIGVVKATIPQLGYIMSYILTHIGLVFVILGGGLVATIALSKSMSKQEESGLAGQTV